MRAGIRNFVAPGLQLMARNSFCLVSMLCFLAANPDFKTPVFHCLARPANFVPRVSNFVSSISNFVPRISYLMASISYFQFLSSLGGSVDKYTFSPKQLFVARDQSGLSPGSYGVSLSLSGSSLSSSGVAMNLSGVSMSSADASNVQYICSLICANDSNSLFSEPIRSADGSIDKTNLCENRAAERLARNSS
jgi:hypothetical protein